MQPVGPHRFRWFWPEAFWVAPERGKPRMRLPIPKDRGPTLAVAATVAFGALVFFLAIFDEPYHIDELRQTDAYLKSFRSIVGLSLRQEQPPLDSLLNAAAQRVIGVGDLQQRLLSVLFGVGTLVVFGTLMLRRKFRWGAPVSVLTLVLSPLLISVTAYARPYALPMFLIVSLLLLIDIWLEFGSAWAATGIIAVSMLLPMSKTIEPNIALIAVPVVLLLANDALRKQWRGTIWMPIGACSAGLALVAVPVILRLLPELGGYTEATPVADKVLRVVTDLPSVLSTATPVWPIFLMVIVVSIVARPSRTLMGRIWWLPVLLAIPVGFAGIFFVSVPAGRDYYLRYTFMWLPPMAVAVGALAHTTIAELTVRRSSEPRTSHVVSRSSAVLLLLVILGIGLSTATYSALTTQTRPDWKAVSKALTLSVSDNSFVAMENLRPLEAWHGDKFYGTPRYIGSSPKVLSTAKLIQRPERVPKDAPIVLLLVSPDSQLDLPGFDRLWTGVGLSLFAPDDPATGPAALAGALEALARALPPRTRAHSALTAATIYASIGQANIACEIVDEFELKSESLKPTVLKLLGPSSGDGSWYDRCT